MTTEAKHTEGPWEFRELSPFDDGLGYISADGRDIIHSGVLDLSKDENLANARLIAAAPDLLAALELFVERDAALKRENPDLTPSARFTRLLEAGEAALAKARGA